MTELFLAGTALLATALFLGMNQKYWGMKAVPVKSRRTERR
jgi:hypothetical protein